MTKKIQVLRPFFRVEETLSEIKECLEIGWTGIGFKTEQFEKAWKESTGFEYAHFLNSATSGLHLAIKIFKEKYSWSDQDEVITTSLTFVSTNHAILYERMSPVFADIDSSLCLDPLSVELLITKKTRAIMYVGVGGNANNYREIKALCEKYNLVFILDAAHMAGTTWIDKETQVGLDSDCAIFSYQAVKNCPSSDSGMICFKSEELDQKARKLSWLGIDKSTFERYSKGSYKWKYDVSELGYKYHGNSIAAAICLVSLRYLAEDNRHRRRLAENYDGFLDNCDNVEVVHHSPLVNSSRHLYQIMVENRDDLMEHLSKEGISCGVHYLANHHYSVYKQFKADVVNSNDYDNKIISLPLHLGLNQDEIEYVSEKIKQYVQ